LTLVNAKLVNFSEIIAMAQLENFGAECCVRGGWLFMRSKSYLGGECYPLCGYSAYPVKCQQADGEADDDGFKPLETVILKCPDKGIEVDVTFALVATVLIVAVDCHERVMASEFFFNRFQSRFQ